ncbi:MAG: hypothetical protein HYU58_12220 [Proteobacteria bacterium]|nr:hypothetical protein [Pseudomonadota bacterium]
MALATLWPLPAVAETDCVPAPGIAGEVATFLTDSAAAQAAGTGTMPIREVLFGVTDIDDEDQGKLDTREKVQLTRRIATGGDYVNLGPKKITVEGIFAGRETLFRLPKRIEGSYRLDDKGALLTYDPAHAVEVGEHILGIPFFMTVHRMSVTPEKLAFYFAGNDGADPDRCYLVQ